MYYYYDAAGNPTYILDANGIGKDLEWNADNQLRSIVDTKEGLSHSYAYNHTGERILKRYGTAQNAFYNGKDMGTLPDFGESYSAYASAYFVENNNGYTKHYYAGATRLVSKLGEGYYDNNELISTGKEEKEQYFYFQDHLGSSTYITDINGEIAQYSAYTPYGEMFREYRNVTPYRFNGKELDTETGLYYYGARYYNPSTALWLGVDPLASKYPGVSPYAFCFSNPINFIDFNGEEPTAEEAALMAKHVYGGTDANDVENRLKNTGWEVSKRDFGLEYTNERNGFKSQLYERTIDGKTEYVYAFAGTDGFDSKDWGQNGLQLFGNSEQHKIAEHNSDILSKELSLTSEELTFVGHSLGGGLAALSSINTGHKAITFNTASLSPATIKTLSNPNTNCYNITNYITLGKNILGTSIRLGGDPLSNLQRNLGFYAPGKYIGVESNSYTLDHSINFFVQ